MATFEELDGLLAEALQCLNDAAGLVRELTQLETKPSLMHLGHAISEAWELRGHVHRIRPDLKPPFVVEYEEDRVRYNKLSEISKEAHQLEESEEFGGSGKVLGSSHRVSARLFSNGGRSRTIQDCRKRE